ncbi:unnamed protein product [Ambrosiozyma monospora]|uniref:Unnamed protein product n=1 Tax=Ambrosiozyma monospora TaxID=43982 RepID=A0ACB5U6L6_AMBMO|nr:unnamed protein product [Ambrosiozyma monospora]
MSLVFGYIFSYNYSGGEAISNLNIILNKEYSDNPLREPVTVHVDVPACMTGVTLFTQLKDSKEISIFYDKTEDKDKLTTDLWDSFSYVITDLDIDSPSDAESALRASKLPEIETSSWMKIDITSLYDGISKNNIIAWGKEVIDSPAELVSQLEIAAKTLKFNYFKHRLERLVKTVPYLYTYQRTNTDDQDSGLNF